MENTKPVTDRSGNDEQPFVKPTGFREYDARWLYGEEINLSGLKALGLGFGALMHRRGVDPKIVTGHDYRAYSPEVANAVADGLIEAGIEVHDIGLALSPTAYFAQFELDIRSVAMITASHNDNGWTGVKMGLDRPLTLGPDDMIELKSIVLGGEYKPRSGGRRVDVEGMAERYMADLGNAPEIKRKLKVVAACGNGTAGAFAPKVLANAGLDVVELDCELDHSFPNYNPNPEDLKMLKALQDKVLETGADLGLGFDGDGDRCGVVDNEGAAIFADKVGVMLARDLSARHNAARFVADVKSTGLFLTDPELKANGASCEYWKTGHSYIKRRSFETGALAGFEKSGHYFFNPPVGRGYDDGLVSALAVCRMLDNAPDMTMADLYRTLPRTWGSPTMSPKCPDEVKYDVVERVTRYYQRLAARGEKIAAQTIRELITVNGIRVVLKDGTWGLVRASSNKPELVVVVESPASEQAMQAMFKNIDMVLSDYPEVGEYNQKI
jgi:phosphomannomutase/phosphoglucomutase